MPNEDALPNESPFAILTPNETSTFIALREWWNDGSPREGLDFSHCSAAEVQEISSAWIQLLAAKTTSLLLPASLTQGTLPTWLSELRAIQLLRLPNYQDSHIDLRQLRPAHPYDLDIGGDRLADAHVSAQADVYCWEMPKSQRAHVYYYGENNNVQIASETVLGHVFYVSQDDKLNFENANAKHKFPDSMEIDCKHITVWELMARQRYAAENPNGSHIESRHAIGRKPLEEEIDPKVHEIFQELLFERQLSLWWNMTS